MHTGAWYAMRMGRTGEERERLEATRKALTMLSAGRSHSGPALFGERFWCAGRPAWWVRRMMEHLVERGLICREGATVHRTFARTSREAGDQLARFAADDMKLAFLIWTMRTNPPEDEIEPDADGAAEDDDRQEDRSVVVPPPLREPAPSQEQKLDATLKLLMANIESSAQLHARLERVEKLLTQTSKEVSDLHRDLKGAP